MEKLLSNFTISVHQSIYHKDPESSELGKRIIKHSIDLIHDIGFDAFTFKKLGVLIGSNESSFIVILIISTNCWSICRAGIGHG